MAERLKTEALEHSGEQGGMLEAIAAAAALDQFGLEPLQVKPHGLTQQDIEILKGDVSYVAKHCSCGEPLVAGSLAAPPPPLLFPSFIAGRARVLSGVRLALLS
jgi:hypothetical protein